MKQPNTTDEWSSPGMTGTSKLLNILNKTAQVHQGEWMHFRARNWFKSTTVIPLLFLLLLSSCVESEGI